MTYYLHRISHCGYLAYPLLDRGILSIGWSKVATREFIRYHQERAWEEVPQAIEQEPEYGKMRARFSLQRFLKMNRDDYVVVPDWRTFHVYKVVSDERLIADDLDLLGDLCGLKTWDRHGVRREQGCLYEDSVSQPQRRIDLGFFRKVKEVARDISRSDYADSKLSSRLKVRQTNVEINDIRKSVEQALAGKPINLASEIIKKCTDDVLNLIKEKLNQDKLEKLIKRYFERIGASSVVIPAKNERDKKGDADVVATFEPIRTIIYVQAKYHDRTTDAWAVEQIDSYVKDKEDDSGETDYTRIPWVISTASDFSTDCKVKARNHRVHLFNGTDLATKLLEAGVAGLDL